MGTAGTPKPVKLFVGMLGADPGVLARAQELLCGLYGAVDLESGSWPFEDTEYYRDELGRDVQRRFISFSDLIEPERLADIKHTTNGLERQLAEECRRPPDRRPANLDPGYLTLSKIVLATTKDYSHRIYLQQGIYAEVTLYFHSGTWNARPWTYPDYACGRYQEFFLSMREKLKAQFAERCPRNRGVTGS